MYHRERYWCIGASEVPAPHVLQPGAHQHTWVTIGVDGTILWNGGYVHCTLGALVADLTTLLVGGCSRARRRGGPCSLCKTNETLMGSYELQQWQSSHIFPSGGWQGTCVACRG